MPAATPNDVYPGQGVGVVRGPAGVGAAAGGPLEASGGCPPSSEVPGIPGMASTVGAREN